MFKVADCASGFVTTTATAPAACAGVRTLIDVALVDRTVACVPPNVTFNPETKLLPDIVTVVPPERVPLVGETLLMLGAGAVYV